MGKVAERLKKCLVSNFWFHIFATFSIILLTAAFLCPPMAVIDASVLAAVGEIFAFAALWAVIKALDEGHTATITHKDTTVTFDDEHHIDEQ